MKLITRNSSKQKSPQNLTIIALFRASSQVYLVASRKRDFQKCFNLKGQCVTIATIMRLHVKRFPREVSLQIRLKFVKVFHCYPCKFKPEKNYIMSCQDFLSMEDKNFIYIDRAVVDLSANFMLNVKSSSLS